MLCGQALAILSWFLSKFHTPWLAVFWSGVDKDWLFFSWFLSKFHTPWLAVFSWYLGKFHTPWLAFFPSCVGKRMEFPFASCVICNEWTILMHILLDSCLADHQVTFELFIKWHLSFHPLSSIWAFYQVTFELSSIKWHLSFLSSDIWAFIHQVTFELFIKWHLSFHPSSDIWAFYQVTFELSSIK